MRKYLLITSLCSSLVAPTQQPEGRLIDSLRNRVANTADTSRINNLNLLAEAISVAKYNDWKKKSDSVLYYASIAYDEARVLNYKKGIAASLIYLGKSQNLNGIYLRIIKKEDFSVYEKGKNYCLQAITLGEELKNDELLANAYDVLANFVSFKDKGHDFDQRANALKKAAFHFNKAGNEKKEQETCTWICEDYSQRGLYEEGLDYCRRSLELAKKVIFNTTTAEDKEYRNYLLQQSLVDIANLYKQGGDYATALEFIKEGRKFGIENKTGWEMEDEIASLLKVQGRYDSALYYISKLYKQDQKNPYLLASLGSLYLKTKGPDEALQYLLVSLEDLRKTTTNGRPLIPVLLDVAEAYDLKKNYSYALKFAREGTNIAGRLNTRPELLEGYELLSRIHFSLKKNDSAYLYLHKYVLLKDSIQNRQLLWRLNTLKRTTEDELKTSQINLLQKENELKKTELSQQGYVRNSLLFGLILLVIIGSFIFRTLRLKRKNEHLRRLDLEKELKVQQLQSAQKQTEFQRQAIELEMQALRAQMNPHFIFNCLSSINRFILKNEAKTASGYLTRFSRLMRMVLQNSQKKSITLEDELQMLRLYLEMERLRFKNAFDYSINFLNEIDSDNIFIPPLILQPFCENAIWHGLMHKGEQGLMIIELKIENEVLLCTITDNGVGRQKAEVLKSKTVEKEKSMGLKITTERLALLNKEKNMQTVFDIEDLKDEDGNAAGTKVALRIQLNAVKEELV